LKSFSSCAAFVLLPRRIGFYGQTLRFVEGDAPGRVLCVARDGYDMTENGRLFNGPFQHLLTAQRSSDQGVDLVDFQVLTQQVEGPDHVAGGDGGERMEVRLSCARIG